MGTIDALLNMEYDYIEYKIFAFGQALSNVNKATTVSQKIETVVFFYQINGIEIISDRIYKEYLNPSES